MQDSSERPPSPGLLARVAACLGTGPLELIGGFENDVYRWHDGHQRRILRLTHISHRNPQQIEAELAFVDFLYQRGAAVCQVVERAGRRVHTFDDFSASMLSEAPGAQDRAGRLAGAAVRGVGQDPGSLPSPGPSLRPEPGAGALRLA